ncbi:MAG: hypothetical protein IJB53_10220, partial [Mailhella sp.]|nr:hypothetical protein [Mailhella sp.]
DDADLVQAALSRFALSRPSLADRLSGTPSAALRPKASHRAGLREGDGGLRAELRLASLARWATRIACA